MYKSILARSQAALGKRLVGTLGGYWYFLHGYQNSQTVLAELNLRPFDAGAKFQQAQFDDAVTLR